MKYIGYLNLMAFATSLILIGKDPSLYHFSLLFLNGTFAYLILKKF